MPEQDTLCKTQYPQKYHLQLTGKKFITPTIIIASVLILVVIPITIVVAATAVITTPTASPVLVVASITTIRPTIICTFVQHYIRQ